MKKNNLRMLAIWTILLVIYHLVTFVIRFEHNTVFWLSYVFSLAAFAVLMAAWYFGEFHGDSTRSKFYGFPILKIGIVYFVVQVLLGWGAMAIAAIPTRPAVLVYAIALAAAGIGIIGADAAKESVQAQDRKLQKNVSTMRALQSQAGQLAAQAEGEAQKSLQSLADALRYSDPVSNASSHDAELELQALLQDLQRALSAGDHASVPALCRKASAVLAERNRLCKLGK